MRTAVTIGALVLALAAGCADDAGPGRADDCWALGAEDCIHKVDARAAVLGITAMDEALFGGTDCGDPLTCNDVHLLSDPGVLGGADTPSSGAERVDPDAHIEPAQAVGTTDPGPDATSDHAVAATTLDPPGLAAGASRPVACDGVDVRGVSQRGTELSASELACLRGIALDHEPLAIDDFTDLQMAAIGLVNARDAGWQQAVERSLSYSELRNSPTLNFAGITPAYNDGRYPVVLNRANSVWSNLDKGYRLSAQDRTFVAEYACRAGVQLHMQGQLSADHERWCRIWVDRLEHEGGDATEAQGLLEQVQ